MVRFIVDGEPQGKQRPRFARRGSYVKTYTPQRTIDYEERIRECYREQVGNEILVDVPVRINIIAYFSIPKSFTKRKRQDAIKNYVKPHNRIDVDNIAKAVLDALNGVAYQDDHYVTNLTVWKQYAEQPRLEIRVSEVKL